MWMRDELAKQCAGDGIEVADDVMLCRHSETKMLDRLVSSPARVVVWTLMGCAIFIRWLFVKPLGFLVLALLAYFVVPRLTSITPMSAGGIVSLIASQPRDVTIAISTALLTIIGFVIAFSVANSAWRAQRRTEIRLAAAEEIYDFFREAWGHLLTLGLYAKFLGEVYEAAHAASLDAGRLEFEGQEIIRRTPQFTDSRLRLSRMSVEVHALRGKHELVLSEEWMALPAFKLAQQSLDKAADAMWFAAPEMADTPIRSIAFVAECDGNDWQKFVRIADENRLKGEMAASSIRGMIISDVIKPNAAMFVSFGRTTKDLLRSIDQAREKFG
jgi:hypothetical protein